MKRCVVPQGDTEVKKKTFVVFFPMFFNPPLPLKGEAAESDQAEMGTNNNLSLSYGHLSLGVKGRRKRTPLLVEKRMVRWN